MRYPIVIEKSKESNSYGVIVPDLEGCFSAGDTLDKAFSNALEAAVGWIECEIDVGHEIPEPSSIEKYASNPEYSGWIFGYIDIPAELLDRKTERINVSMPKNILKRLDDLARASGNSRSGYIAQLVLDRSAESRI